MYLYINIYLYNQYISSYIDADLVICPSKHSNKVMQEFGCKNTTVIPHGCYEGVNYPYPKTFSVGYLGQIGPDKGVKYLIEAWAKLNYKDAVLTFAGQQSPYLIHMIRQFGGRANYNILGYVKTLDEFFKSINVYILYGLNFALYKCLKANISFYICISRSGEGL